MKKALLSIFSLLPTAALFAKEATASGSKIDLMEVFRGSPLIYAVLFGLSLFSFSLWLYSLLTLKMSKIMPEEFVKQLKGHILEKRFDIALNYCEQADHISGTILASGLQARKRGTQLMLEAMHSEGKRCGIHLWQRIALLNDVAVISPMLGLLGTVVGMFYAFYDVNRSADTLSSIFDGLGIAIGTTVAGLIVAIMAMIFYTTLKFRVVRLLNTIENEAISVGNLINSD